MNTDKLNKWLSLLANIGVVIGLALLIFEIRQNSELVRAQIHQARSDAYVSARQELADSEHIIVVWQKLEAAGGPRNVSALSTLDPLETHRLYRYLQARAGDYDNLFYQHRQGYLDEEFYESRVKVSVKYFAPLWLELGVLDNMTPSFKNEVERLTTEGN